MRTCRKTCSRVNLCAPIIRTSIRIAVRAKCKCTRGTICNVLGTKKAASQHAPLSPLFTWRSLCMCVYLECCAGEPHARAIDGTERRQRRYAERHVTAAAINLVCARPPHNDRPTNRHRHRLQSKCGVKSCVCVLRCTEWASGERVFDVRALDFIDMYVNG